MKITRKQIRKLIQEAMSLPNDFDARVESFAVELERLGFKQCGPPGHRTQEEWNAADFYIEPTRGFEAGAFVFIPAGKSFNKFRKESLSLYVTSAARDQKIRVKRLGGARFLLADKNVASPELVLRGKIAKIRKALKAAGFVPRKERYADDFRGNATIDRSTGDYDLKPAYDKKSYIFDPKRDRALEEIVTQMVGELGLEMKKNSLNFNIYLPE
jgi:hypothetical protein